MAIPFGYRPQLPPGADLILWAIAEDCWQRDAVQRPTMRQILDSAAYQHHAVAEEIPLPRSPVEEASPDPPLITSHIINIPRQYAIPQALIRCDFKVPTGINTDRESFVGKNQMKHQVKLDLLVVRSKPSKVTVDVRVPHPSLHDKYSLTLAPEIYRQSTATSYSQASEHLDVSRDTRLGGLYPPTPPRRHCALKKQQALRCLSLVPPWQRRRLQHCRFSQNREYLAFPAVDLAPDTCACATAPPRSQRPCMSA